MQYINITVLLISIYSYLLPSPTPVCVAVAPSVIRSIKYFPRVFFLKPHKHPNWTDRKIIKVGCPLLSTT